MACNPSLMDGSLNMKMVFGFSTYQPSSALKSSNSDSNFNQNRDRLNVDLTVKLHVV